MSVWLWVFAGGAAGSLLRGVASLYGNGSPMGWGTLAVNVLGSFFAGFCVVWAWPAHVSSALLVGFCGGFTTYSALALQSLLLWRGGERGRALLVLFLNLCGGLLAVFGGACAGLWLQRL